MISFCQPEPFLVVLYRKKGSSRNEMVGLELLSAQDAQMKQNNTVKHFLACKHTKNYELGKVISIIQSIYKDWENNVICHLSWLEKPCFCCQHYA